MSEVQSKGYECPVEFALDLISGKWKVLIIWELQVTKRFTELERSIPGVKRKVLVNQLRELELCKIIARKVYPQVPPKVEYSLTETGRDLLKIFHSLTEWSQQHMETVNKSL